MWSSATLATETSSTSMKVAIEITKMISHGECRPAAERAGVQPIGAGAAASLMAAPAPWAGPTCPGPSGQSCGRWSNTSFTGTRCTTFTKLPVAFSGGSRAKAWPAPRWIESTWARSGEPAAGVDPDVGALADPHQGELGLLEVGGDPEVVRHDRHQLLARRDVAAGRDVEVGDMAVDRRDDARVAQRDVALLGLRLAGRMLRLERADLRRRDPDLGGGVLGLLERREVLRGGVARRLQRLVELLRRDRLWRRRAQVAVAGEVVGGLRAWAAAAAASAFACCSGARRDHLRALLDDLSLGLRRLGGGLLVLGAEGEPDRCRR